MSTLIADQARWTARAAGRRRDEVGRRDDAGQRRVRAESTLSMLDGMGGEPTLDDVLAGIWEGLTAHAVVECPICCAPMAPEYGAHALPIGGRCGGCLSSLS